MPRNASTVKRRPDAVSALHTNMATARKVAQQAVRARRVFPLLRITVRYCEAQDDLFATIVNYIQADRCRQRQFVAASFSSSVIESQILQFEIIDLKS